MIIIIKNKNKNKNKNKKHKYKDFLHIISLTHIWKGPHMQSGDWHQAELYCICIKMKDRGWLMYTFLHISKKEDYFSCSGNTSYQQRNQLCIKLPLPLLNKAGPKRDRMEPVEYYNQILTQRFQAFSIIIYL